MDPAIKDFLSFLDNAPTSWHAVREVKTKLKAEGFEELSEDKLWHLKPEKKYFLVRNGSILAFTLPKESPKKLKVAAAHTDSPALKLKPNPEFSKETMMMLGVEVYGAPLLSSWLNRDLKISGRILLEGPNGTIQEKLIDLENHPVIIPQLAIHLDRNVNENGLVLNKQEQLNALATFDFPKNQASFLQTLIKSENILGSDLFLVPVEKATCLGFQQEMIASYRLDNLESVYAALTGFLEWKNSNKNQLHMIVFWDHEEIGSTTAHGAESPFFSHTLERITSALGMNREQYFALLANGLCLSIDMAHALHPNHTDKHDPRHAPLLGKGIVLKHNAQQRYATDGRSAAIITKLCQEYDLPLQKFVTRSDMPCGSTIGPILSSQTGILTADIGCPQLSMHSIREVMATKDHLTMCQFTKHFFSN